MKNTFAIGDVAFLSGENRVNGHNIIGVVTETWDCAGDQRIEITYNYNGERDQTIATRSEWAHRASTIQLSAWTAKHAPEEPRTKYKEYTEALGIKNANQEPEQNPSPLKVGDWVTYVGPYAKHREKVARIISTDRDLFNVHIFEGEKTKWFKKCVKPILNPEPMVTKDEATDKPKEFWERVAKDFLLPQPKMTLPRLKTYQKEISRAADRAAASVLLSKPVAYRAAFIQAIGYLTQTDPEGVKRVQKRHPEVFKAIEEAEWEE